MTGPMPVQIRRVRGWSLPPNTVVVARPGIWGNPFRVEQFGLEQAVALHRTWLEAEDVQDLGYAGEMADLLNGLRAELLRRLPELRGKNLACYCPLPSPGERDRCHRAFLMELANR